MVKILNSDLPDQEKLIRYHEVLQTSLILQEFNQPTVEKKEQQLLPSENLSKKDDEEMKLVKKDNDFDFFFFV